MVVFPDVDVEAAVAGCVFGMNLNVCQGQSCGSNSRVLVHERIHDEFVELLAARLDEFRVTTAYREESDMGPLVSRAHYERVAGYVASGQVEGARLVTGGGKPEEAPDGGYFLRPAAFDRVEQSMAIANDEIFGPVISVLSWKDYDAMVEQANAVELGLTASIWTNDLTLAHKTAARLDAGYVWINHSTIHYVGTPFGGTKNSGTPAARKSEEGSCSPASSRRSSTRSSATRAARWRATAGSDGEARARVPRLARAMAADRHHRHRGARPRRRRRERHGHAPAPLPSPAPTRAPSSLWGRSRTSTGRRST